MKKNFTLLELLIVIAIIGILAAILFPATMTALNYARTSRARSEINALQTALREYSNEYRGFDKLNNSTGVIDPNKNATNYETLLSALSMREYAGNQGSLRKGINTYNPKKRVFWDATPEDFSSKDYQGFKDPWGNYYVIWLDIYGDGWCGPGGNNDNGNGAFHLPAAVFSPGPNGEFELDVTNGGNVNKFRKKGEIDSDDVMVIK